MFTFRYTKPTTKKVADTILNKVPKKCIVCCVLKEHGAGILEILEDKFCRKENSEENLRMITKIRQNVKLLSEMRKF